MENFISEWLHRSASAVILLASDLTIQNALGNRKVVTTKTFAVSYVGIMQSAL